MQAKIVMFEPRRVVGLAVEGDPWRLPQAWSRLPSILRDHGLDRQAKAWLSTFPPAGNAPGRYAAAVELPLPESGGPACPPELEEWLLPAGLCAVVVHFGSSEEIGATVDRWEKDWLPGSSWEADPQRPRWEWYQNINVPPGSRRSAAARTGPTARSGCTDRRLFG
jgi:DNA gyrase inhibitor GyrI